MYFNVEELRCQGGILFIWHLYVKLIRRAMIFWKLAEDIEDENGDLTQEYYDNWVKKELPTANLEDIQLFLDARAIQKFVNIEDFLPRIYYLTTAPGMVLGSEISWIWSFFGRWKETITKYILQRLLKEKGSLTVDEYFVFEEYASGDKELMRQAATIIIKRIMEWMKSDNDADHQKGELVLQRLIDHSDYFDHDFLNNLVKHFGVLTYNRMMSEYDSDNRSLETILKKSVITIWDVADIQRNWALTREEWQIVIDKVDGRARQYLRGFLYGITGDHLRYLFMLSDDMQPMNINYETVGWPEDRIRMVSIKELRKELQDKWAQVFHEFNVIPQ
jgi:hypothetical protein